VAENLMGWLGIHGSDGKARKKSFANAAVSLETLYRDKLLPLEKDSNFHHFHQPELPPAFFTSRPMILTVGQYSTGKTTFIQHLLGHDYPTAQIGPEPTTDRFICVCHGEQTQLIPGNALVYDQTLPFQPLSKFGNGFLQRLACARIPNPILEGVSFIDTPGVLAGEKQRTKRGYDFEEVMAWFIEHASLVILFFDAHKLDVSDEFKRSLTALASAPQKVHVILNKADIVTTQELLRVHGALMWSLGKVMNTPEVARVYMGSFWGDPCQNEELRELFEQEQEDLYRHIEQLPRQSTMHKINELDKRARKCKAHATLIEYLRSQMPAMWGAREKQEELILELGRCYSECSRLHQVSIGDFPPVNVMRDKLQHVDLTQVRRLDQYKMKGVADLLGRGIPGLMAMVPPEHEGEDMTAGSSAGQPYYPR
jgi:GTPase SAR1 family protein